MKRSARREKGSAAIDREDERFEWERTVVAAGGTKVVLRDVVIVVLFDEDEVVGARAVVEDDEGMGLEEEVDGATVLELVLVVDDAEVVTRVVADVVVADEAGATVLELVDVELITGMAVVAAPAADEGAEEAEEVEAVEEEEETRVEEDVAVEAAEVEAILEEEEGVVSLTKMSGGVRPSVYEAEKD